MNDLYLVVIDSNDTEQYDEIIHILRNNRFTIKGTPKRGFMQVTVFRINMECKTLHISHYSQNNHEYFRGFVWNIITPKILKQILMEQKNDT